MRNIMTVPELPKFETPKIPKTPTKYPAGVLLLTEVGNWYLMGKQSKFEISSSRVLESWDFAHVVYTSEIALSKIPTLKTLGFRNGTLIKNIADAKLYLISDGKRRQIQNPDVLDLLFLREEDALLISQDETNLHEEGEPLK